jgi:maleate isomerase
VIAINAATLWHALRANGFTDQVLGAGRLLREF